VKGKENFLVKIKKSWKMKKYLKKKKRLFRTARIQIWKQTKDVH